MNHQTDIRILFPVLNWLKKSELRLSLPNCQRTTFSPAAVSRSFPLPETFNFIVNSTAVNSRFRNLPNSFQKIEFPPLSEPPETENSPDFPQKEAHRPKTSPASRRSCAIAKQHFRGDSMALAAKFTAGPLLFRRWLPKTATATKMPLRPPCCLTRFRTVCQATRKGPRSSIG